MQRGNIVGANVNTVKTLVNRGAYLSSNLQVRITLMILSEADHSKNHGHQLDDSNFDLTWYQDLL